MNQTRGNFRIKKLKKRELQMNTIFDSDEKNLTIPEMLKKHLK